MKGFVSMLDPSGQNVRFKNIFETNPFAFYRKHPLLVYFKNDIPKSKNEKNELEKKLDKEWKDFELIYNRVKGLLNTSPRVAFWGAFSAGKSSLINAIMKKSVLPEDLDECTAIPTVLRKGNKERVFWEKRNEDGSVYSYEPKDGLTDFRNIRKGETDNLLVKAYLNEFDWIVLEAPDIPEHFKEIEFLDTPGFHGIDDKEGRINEKIRISRLLLMQLFL
ncbi:MAG: dynamin family protein [Thermodesulforhabdaceae bacterium]